MPGASWLWKHQEANLQRNLKNRLAGLGARLVRRPRLSVAQFQALQPRRILIVRQHNQMGDMICATPALRAIRTAFPDAELALVTAPVNVEVVRHNPNLDRILTFDQKMWRNPVRLSRFAGQVRGWGAELALVLGSVSFSVTSAAIALLSGARYVVGPDSTPFGWDFSRHAFSLEMPASPELDRPAVEHSLAPLAGIGITTDDLSTVVVPAPEEQNKADRIMAELDLQDGFWALHPGAGKGQNVWPPERFAEMAARAANSGRQVLILHGPADGVVLAQLRDVLGEEPGRGIRVAPPASVGTAAALLLRADRFLCNDTGIMHVAGAVGVPTVALFGPTDPDLWKPPAESVTALRSPRQVPDGRGREYGWMEELEIDVVWQTWQDLAGRTSSARTETS